MAQSKKTTSKLLCLFLLVIAALAVTFGAPKKVHAAKTYTFMISPENTGKIKIKGNIITFKNCTPYDVANERWLPRGTYRCNLTKKTKYREAVNTEKRKTKALKKSKALKKLKKKKFIAVYLTNYKKGTVKKVQFGV